MPSVADDTSTIVPPPPSAVKELRFRYTVRGPVILLPELNSVGAAPLRRVEVKVLPSIIRRPSPDNVDVCNCTKTYDGSEAGERANADEMLL